MKNPALGNNIGKILALLALILAFLVLVIPTLGITTAVFCGAVALLALGILLS